jgi:hypothetical protein
MKWLAVELNIPYIAQDGNDLETTEFHPRVNLCTAIRGNIAKF